MGLDSLQRPHLTFSHAVSSNHIPVINILKLSSRTVELVQTHPTHPTCHSPAVPLLAIREKKELRNNQFGESFGSQILETPFVRAIEYAEATILIVDRDAGSLTRSWRPDTSG